MVHVTYARQLLNKSLRIFRYSKFRMTLKFLDWSVFKCPNHSNFIQNVDNDICEIIYLKEEKTSFDIHIMQLHHIEYNLLILVKMNS